VLFEPATGEARALFVCAHGAGGHMTDRSLQALAPRLRACGLDLVRFNFPYRDEGSRRPDPMPVLQAAFADVTERARRDYRPRKLLLGGRSMGGRVASHLAAQGFACDALLLLAYPLHPPGKTEKLRAEHLGEIRVPVLCINGTEDALCRRELMQHVVETMRNGWHMHWLEGADHSFHVRKSSGRTDAQVLDEIAGAIRGWLHGSAVVA
jgi:predicted alpha/beta-hydrolase family hydrolase